jgi:diacylglycerol kinase (ATP)
MTRNSNKPDDIKYKSYAEYKDDSTPHSVPQSFAYAINGILDVFRTQRHMRFHFMAAIMVLITALLVDVSKNDYFILIVMISLVLITEMFNTTIEAVVDLITQEYNPIAKFVKDAAAGAVLIATTAAVMVAVLLVANEVKSEELVVNTQHNSTIMFKILITGIILFGIVSIIKLLTKGGTLLRGGAISGHSAFGFFFVVTLYFLTKNLYITVLGFLMALLVAQSRVQANIHSLQEVVIGGIVSILVCSVLYHII